MALTGVGFSIVPQENIIATGSASTIASRFEVIEDNRERITFRIPENTSEGETSLLVIVNGKTSNALSLTVTP